MTALVIISTDFGFHIMSDGANYCRDTGTVGGWVQKVDALPSYSGFVAARGNCGIVASFRCMMDVRVASFDAMISQTSDVLRAIADDCLEQYDESLDFTLFLGGWSESRERFEAYAISPTDRPSRQAFELLAIEGGTVVAGPSVEALDLVGHKLTEQGEVDLSSHSLPMIIHAARMAETPSNAGGYIQETFIGRDIASSRIVYRYGDRVGQPMIPAAHETDEIRAICEARRDDRGFS